MGCGASSKQVAGENAEVMPMPAATSALSGPTTTSQAANVSQRLIREHTSGSERIEAFYDGASSTDESTVLGRGATSTVRRITHKTTGEVYALKTLAINRMAKDKVMELLQEVEMMKKLDHPNIIRIIETFRTANKLYIVMELCTGGELFDKLYDQPNTRFTEPVARQLMLKMCTSLNYLHAAGIAHRDLKLENFIFTNKSEDAEVKLIDFGYSQNYLSGAHMTQIVGTAYYIAPEVLEGDYTKACDVWSMGVIFYMLLSGRCPFGGVDDDEIQEAVRSSKLKFHPATWGEISDGAIDLCKKMINRSVGQRLTCAQVLKHPWMTHGAGATVDKHIPNEEFEEAEHLSLNHMRKFRDFNQLKKTALMAIAFSLGDEQLQVLRTIFQDMDSEKTGVLNMKEFKQAMHDHSDIADEEVEKIFNALDQDHSGVVKYSEFLAAAMQEQLYLEEDKIHEAFNKLDLNHNGKITKDNLRELLGEGTDDAALDRIIADADYHQNGYIDLEEFQKMMLGGHHPTPREE